jgi:hypothetical protein
MGMVPHIDSWSETGAYLSYVTHEEGSEFQQVLESSGTSAALKWREERFGDKP